VLPGARPLVFDLDIELIEAGCGNRQMENCNKPKDSRMEWEEDTPHRAWMSPPSSLPSRDPSRALTSWS